MSDAIIGKSNFLRYKHQRKLSSKSPDITDFVAWLQFKSQPLRSLACFIKYKVKKKNTNCEAIINSLLDNSVAILNVHFCRSYHFN